MLLLTCAQMRRVDQAMIERIGVSELSLMEAAGLAVAQAAIYLARKVYGRRSCSKDGKVRYSFLIVAGKGHNGADGLVAARHLHALGHNVRVCLAESRERLSPNCVRQLGAYESIGGVVALDEDLSALKPVHVVIDALLGMGSRLPLKDVLRPWASAIRELQCPVVSIDMPTGIDSDTGEVDPDAIRADVTVACGFAKVGLFQYPACDFAGRVEIASLSMPEDIARQMGASCELLTPDVVFGIYRPRPHESHKGTFGKVGVLAGSQGMYGAAKLATMAAYRAGAGLVAFLAPADLPEAVAQAMPAETVIHHFTIGAGRITREGIRDWVDLMAQTSCTLCGPGMGKAIHQVAQEHSAWLNTLAKVETPLVLDADFLHAISLMPAKGENWLRQRSAPTVLTPHPKEFGRLTGLRVEQIQADRVGTASAYAKANRVIVVLKGAGTVVAAPDGTTFINMTGNSGLATGGTGDVLAGLIAGMIGSGYEALQASALAVYLHGKAADLACEATASEESLLASDLLVWIGRAILTIGGGDSTYFPGNEDVRR